MRKVQGVIGALAVSAALVVPLALSKYGAEDIVVPPGYIDWVYFCLSDQKREGS